MIVIAQTQSQDGPALRLDYVSRFQYIDPVLLDAVLGFIQKKNWLSSS
jgi:hypothetical protein